nr:transcription elongation factor Spt5 [Cryptomonas curvata]
MRQNCVWKFLINKINKNYFCIILKNSFQNNFSLDFKNFPITMCNKSFNQHLIVETFFLISPIFDFETWCLNISKMSNCIIYEKSELNRLVIQLLHTQSNIMKINIHQIYAKKINKNKYFFTVNKIENDFIYLKNSNQSLVKSKVSGKKCLKKNKSILKHNYGIKKIHLKRIKEKNNFTDLSYRTEAIPRILSLYIENKKIVVEQSKLTFEFFIKTLRIDLFDILIFDKKKFGSIVIDYNDESLTVLEINNFTKKLNINSLFFFKKIEKNKIKSNSIFDFKGNVLFTGEVVKIISGIYTNYNVIIKYIQLNYLFVFSKKIIINNGIFCIKSEDVNIFTK